jgi:hypothetical protein
MGRAMIQNGDSQSEWDVNIVLWNCAESWVRSCVELRLLHRIDIQQIVNDSLYQWHALCRKGCVKSDAELLSPILKRILRCRLRDELKTTAREKRGGNKFLQELNEELVCGVSISFDEIETNDVVDVLGSHLNAQELMVLELRILGYEDSAIERLASLSATKIKGIRRHITMLFVSLNLGASHQ